jgi:agmatine deiminase
MTKWPVMCGIFLPGSCGSDKFFFHPFPAYELGAATTPIFVVKDVDNQRHRAVVDWDYNAWGGKYPPYDSDDQVPVHVATIGIFRFSSLK